MNWSPRRKSAKSAFELSAALIAAAIVVPPFQDSKTADNEASAIRTVHTIVTAEVTYMAMFPEKGFAPDLATLGPDPGKPDSATPEHAALLSDPLGNESCTANAWCTKFGYRFRLIAVCTKGLCTDYVVMATPVDKNTGTRSFCAMVEGEVRFKAGSPLKTPVSVAECRAWAPLG